MIKIHSHSQTEAFQHRRSQPIVSNTSLRPRKESKFRCIEDTPPDPEFIITFTQIEEYRPINPQAPFDCLKRLQRTCYQITHQLKITLRNITSQRMTNVQFALMSYYLIP